MQMREMAAIDLAPGAKVALKPGGMHAMIEGLKQPLSEGKSFPLSLAFEKAGDIKIMVLIGKIGAMQHEHMKGM
jgi:copper(I)-binding protein